jgi:hypothetical protein
VSEVKTDNSGLLAFVIAVCVCLVIRWLVLRAEEQDEQGLTPVTRRGWVPWVFQQFRGCVRRRDTAKNDPDTPSDTPSDTTADTLPEEDDEEIAGGSLIRGKPRVQRVSIPKIVTLSSPETEEQPKALESVETADPETIRRWITRVSQHKPARSRSNIIRDGQEIFGVSAATMHRRYREVFKD